MKIFLVIASLFFCCLVYGQKKTPDKKPIAVYESDGHYYVELKLFPDSSFRYLLVTDVMFIQRRSHGIYARTDSTITLHTRRNFAFLRSVENKSWSITYRLKGKELLMFSEEQEQSADGNFYRDYYTLTLRKSES